MDNLIENALEEIRAQIQTYALECHRSPASVHLLAVSKGQSITKIQQAYEAGQVAFGENYVQEALEKILSLRHLNLSWHYLGNLQSNKLKSIAAHFSWVHSLATLSIADGLNAKRSPLLPPLNVCIQVNLDGEESKGGIAVGELLPLVRAVSQLPQLRLRGLMCIPKPEKNPSKQYTSFVRLKILLDTLNKELGLSMDTLSMGMSQDFGAAIKAGSSIVRIGEALFGKRGG